ncbi:peptide/nickel transport system ATP-binding protein [Actinocorallia herbida]|uniref:Peptide/nickel transport system ATP-binding protein n=1 Tax=Actinocorallia herbida TaxID=58109 RepID=A0A3N1D9G0_9ACTN|nr:ATP-binding cassette domain-containing protein [Actinocorallia herbida]ROO89718.1 peptide/nickel transport system ATP-binding protein [Actinocorallia herbida]
MSPWKRRKGASAPSESGVTVEGLRVRYGAFTAVDGVSFSIGEGEVLGLVGESGSGKSTVGRALAGLVPYEGEVRGGARTQMVFQDPYGSLDPRMRIGAAVAEGLGRDLSRAARSAEARRLLEVVGLSGDLAARYPRELSGGQRQRVALARALGARPGLLIADEITSALDASVQGAVLNLVRDLRDALGLSVLFVSHDLAVVRYVCDRVAVLREGRIVECGTVEQVTEVPGHEYTKALLEAVPRLK